MDICLADAGTCLPAAPPPLLLQPAAASDAAVPTATAMTAARCRFLRAPILPNCLLWPDHVVIVATSFASSPRNATANWSAVSSIAGELTLQE